MPYPSGKAECQSESVSLANAKGFRSHNGRAEGEKSGDTYIYIYRTAEA